jgi:hypothetical protein
VDEQLIIYHEIPAFEVFMQLGWLLVQIPANPEAISKSVFLITLKTVEITYSLKIISIA